MSDRCVPEGPPETVRSFDEATLVQRCQFERQLHDGPALRLAALSLRLGLCSHQIGPEANQELRKSLAEIQEELHEVLQELRGVAGRIYPPVLSAAGLSAALEAMAEQYGLPITVRGPDERYSATVEAAAYFAVAERLLSRGDHSSTVTVAIRSIEDELRLKISAEGEAEAAPIELRIVCG